MNKSTLIYLLILLFGINNNFYSQKRKTKKQELTYDESLYNSINYRLIGPFRGGRAGTATGILTDSNTYYM